MSGIYATSFIQYGLLWILIAFSDRDHAGICLPFLKDSIYDDFNSAWFLTIGTIIVENQVVLAFMPIINFFMSYIIRHFLRMYD